MTSRPRPSYKRIGLETGSYCQVADEPAPSNTNTAYTTGETTLVSSDNKQGGNTSFPLQLEGSFIDVNELSCPLPQIW